MSALKGFNPTLRWDKILLLAMVLLGLNAGLYLLSQKVYLQSFAELEYEVAYENLSRSFRSLYHDVDNLKVLAADWAERDSTYRHMAEFDKADGGSSFSGPSLQDLSLDFVILISPQGEVVSRTQFDPQSLHLVPFDKSLESFLVGQAREVLAEEDLEPYAGLQHYQGRLMLLAFNPVLPTSGHGPVAGLMATGRFVDEMYLADLSYRTRVDLDLEIWPEEKVRSYIAEKPDQDVVRGRGLHFVTEAQSDKEVTGFVFLQDFDGHFGPVLVSNMDRVLYRQGEKAVWLFLLWSCVLSLVSALLVYLVMDRLAQVAQRQREDEERYRRLSTEFKTILDGIPDKLTLVNVNGNTVWRNRAASDSLLRGSRDEQGRHIVDVSNHADRSPTVAKALKSGLTAEDIEEDTAGRKIRIKAFPVKNERNELISVVKLAIDVTDKIRMRQELEQNSRLAALGELSAGVAHEINNPNGMIQMNLGLIGDVWGDLVPVLDDFAKTQGQLVLGGLPYDRLRDELPLIFDEMAAGGRKIRTIVEDLKGFARKDPEDKIQEEVMLNEVVRASERLVASHLRKSMAEYEWIQGVRLPSVIGDFRQLEQVVINLLINACQAIDQPGKLIQVRTWYDVARLEVVLIVKDEGRGIAPVDLAKIKDPFYTTRREEGGTGLGLSVSSRIVNEHGGRLDFRSQPGVGTEAELRLPASKELNS